MKSILVLQQPTSSSPIDHWLLEADPDVELVIVTGPNSIRKNTYAEGVKVVEVEDYFAPQTMLFAYQVARTMGAERVVSNAEQDVLRAAELRDALGLPGMSTKLARAFRDKLEMKRLFADAGLTCAEAAPVHTVQEILVLARQHGRGVVKPRDGMGSKGLVVVDSDMDHAAVFDLLVPHLDDLHAGRLMWEKFVQGDGLHCDVTLSDTQIKTFSVSRTLAPPHLYATHNYTSYTLDDADPAYAKARACTEALVNSLPAEHGVSMLHFELFEDPDGLGLTAGEVGARMGGGGIRAAVREVTGRDLAQEGYLLAAGLGEGIIPTPPPAAAAGWMLFTAVQPELPDPKPRWLVSTWTRQRSTAQPQHSVDALGGMIVREASSRTLRETLESLSWHSNPV